MERWEVDREGIGPATGPEFQTPMFPGIASTPNNEKQGEHERFPATVTDKQPALHTQLLKGTIEPLS